ncbi:hypothetical protein [Sphingobacterium multivorum]
MDGKRSNMQIEEPKASNNTMSEAGAASLDLIWSDAMKKHTIH